MALKSPENPLREVESRATAAQRELIEPYLHAGVELEVAGFGGSRYGGKTWTGAQCIGYRRLMYRNTRALCLRTVMRASELNMGEEFKVAFFEPHGFPVGSRNRGEIQYLAGENRFLFPNGSMIQLGYCKRPDDWQQHLGLQWDDIWFEQAEQFPERVYSRLRGSNRPNNPKCISRTLLTFNPGGIGSEWLYRRIVSPKTRDRRVIWVKSMVEECMATLERDPSYVLRSLMSITDPVLRAQWLRGDWDIQSGIYFRLLPETYEHPGTLREITPPYWADWYGGVDWGYHDPFCYLIGAHWKDDKGKPHLHIAAEFYRTSLDLDEQAEAALDLEKQIKKRYPLMHDVEVRIADPSTVRAIEGTSDQQTRSKATVWREYGFDTYPAFRYSRTSRHNLVRYLIRHGILTIDECCENLIREIKSAIRKEDSEDIDQNRCDDHALDSLEYMVCYLFGLDYAVEPEEDKRWDALRGAEA